MKLTTKRFEEVNDLSTVSSALHAAALGQPIGLFEVDGMIILLQVAGQIARKDKVSRVWRYRWTLYHGRCELAACSGKREGVEGWTMTRCCIRQGEKGPH